jgi:hypothetical protein
MRRSSTRSIFRFLAKAACGICAAVLALPLPSSGASAPAIADQNSRNLAITNDFLRFVFVPTTAPPPTAFGLAPRKRLFFEAANFLVPPLTVRQDITFPGLADSPAQTLYAIRCQPTAGSGVDPILVSWPNFFIAISQDFGSQGFACPAPPGASGENQAYCIASQFMDLPQQYADQALVNTLKPGLELFKIMVTGPVPPPPAPPPKLRPFPSVYYGAFPPFTGVGYAVSGSGDGHLLTAADTTTNLIVPEYLLKNVNLTQGNCHFIGVPPTPDPTTRLNAQLDMDVIWNEGNAACPLVTLPQ